MCVKTTLTYWFMTHRLIWLIKHGTPVLTLLKTFTKLQFSIISTQVMSFIIVNRPYSYSRYWTGTSLQWRLMRGNIIKKRFTSFAIAWSIVTWEKPSRLAVNFQRLGQINKELKRRVIYIYRQILFQKETLYSVNEKHSWCINLYVFLRNKRRRFSNQRTIILKNEQNLRIFWTKNEHCYQHKMLSFTSIIDRAYRDRREEY